MNPLYLLFALTIFISSFLLFQVQPLLGKHILPWFGGSSEVWVTAMLFFMVALAVGYIYAQILSKLRVWQQAIIHIVIIISSIILIKKNTLVWSSAITPALDNLSLDFSDPDLAVLKTLTVAVGLPFALLSSSSSLLQMWYTKVSDEEPFSLYGISNIGSLLGLLSYPLFFERFYPTYTQGEWWSYGFLAYIGLLLVVLYVLLLFYKKATKVPVHDTSVPVPTKRDFFVWLGITSVPVMVMLSGTTFMTTSIAPVPFLWVGPLALYLLSFAITFRKGPRLPMWANEILLLFTTVTVTFTVLLTNPSVLVSVVITHLALFAVYHWCHEHLYALRPDPSHLTTFYVALSLGGIAGSILIKVSNNYLLPIPIELLLLLVGSVAVIVYQWRKREDYYVPIATSFQLRLLSAYVLVGLVLGGAVNVYKQQNDTLAQDRNFFGYKAVVEKISEDGDEKIVSLQHGKTNHGFQVYKNGEPQVSPVSYYSETSGIGKTFAYKRKEKPEGLNVAVLGLGSGSLLAYCEPGDNFTFFEIDPEIVEISENHFTYLEHCQQVEINLIDARLGLAEQAKTKTGIYDLIIVDAYADDAAPIHLMTSEAVALYKSLLTDQGVLNIHISSRYLDLLPVIKAIAKDNSMPARYHSDDSKAEYATASLWTILAKDEDAFKDSAFAEVDTFAKVEKEILWTDTFSALWPVVKMR